MGDEAPRPRKKKKRKKLDDPSPPAPPPVATSWLPTWLSYVTIALASAFLVLVFSDAYGWEWLGNKVARPARYFTQIACLFPSADRAQVEYHAEGFRCRDKRWVEIDVRPFFPIDAEEKENRFQRTMHFYKRDRATMNALDAFIVDHEKAAGDPIGGVRFSSLAIPFPTFGDKVARYAWHPIASVPAAWKHDHYWSKRSMRRERCTAIDPSYEDKGLEEDKPQREPAPDTAREREPRGVEEIEP